VIEGARRSPLTWESSFSDYFGALLQAMEYTGFHSFSTSLEL